MTEMEKPLGPIWPQPGATPPSFDSPQAAAAFVAELCGLTFNDLAFKAPSDDKVSGTASAWFPGIPHTTLIYRSEKGTYRLTEGATGIVRNTQAGKFTADHLTTPYKPPTLNPNLLSSLVLRPGTRFDHSIIPLLKPEDAGEIDEKNEAVGTLEVIDEGQNKKVTLVLEDGRHLPFTDAAAGELEIADPIITNLNGQTGVFRIDDIPDPNRNSTQTIRAVVEVYLEDE